MENNKISIIIPCYKQAVYLDEALQSVLNQKYSNWECLIINDGSPDNTEEIALKWCLLDDRFIYIKKENGGLSSARNKGLDNVKGDYIQFLDCDDLLDKDKLIKSISEIETNDQKIIVSNFKMFKGLKNKIQYFHPYCVLMQKYFNFEEILFNWDKSFTIPIHCGLFPVSVFNKIRFNEKLKAKEDWLFWIKASQLGINFHFIDENLAYYRINEIGMTRDFELMKNNTMLVIKEIKTIIPETLYEKFILHKLDFFITEKHNIEKKHYEYKKSIFDRIIYKIYYLFKIKK